MTYLFLGTDDAAKQHAIAELKKKICLSANALQFDCDTLYASKLDSDDFRRSLLLLPAFSKERLIIIKECHKLSAHNQEILLDFLNAKHCVLVLESDKLEASDSLTKKLAKTAKVQNFKGGVPLNTFDLTRLIGKQKSAEALKTLSQLLSDGEQPLKIMGGLVWFWKEEKDRVSTARFQEGLQALQEADLNIKRNRLKSDQHALELLVVKLCSKEAC